MAELIIWTYDRVPKGARGLVRDLRLRWACEEADLVYAVRTIPFDGREANHLARQPFGQVPFLNDGSLEIFESEEMTQTDTRSWTEVPFGNATVTAGRALPWDATIPVTIPNTNIRIQGSGDGRR